MKASCAMSSARPRSLRIRNTVRRTEGNSVRKNHAYSSSLSVTWSASRQRARPRPTPYRRQAARARTPKGEFAETSRRRASALRFDDERHSVMDRRLRDHIPIALPAWTLIAKYAERELGTRKREPVPDRADVV